MRVFHIMTNGDKEAAIQEMRRICELLTEKGCTCTSEVLRRYEMPEEPYFPPEDVECMIVLGGDGTMIQAAGMVAGRVPLIGVNLGTLGFLQEVETEQVPVMIERLVAEEYEIEKRMMLAGSMGGDRHFTALNDIVISRCGALKALHFVIFVNDMLLGNYTADGMILSTPTGSTAYNLSAGGPIVEPDAEAILLTPICPHNLNSRSIVLSAQDRIRVEIVRSRHDSGSIAAASFDGASEMRLQPGDAITIAKAVETTRIVKLSRESFLKILSRKMSEG